MNIPEEDRKETIRILQWLVYSARPLNIQEVSEIVAIDLDAQPQFSVDRRLFDPQSVLPYCSTLVTLSTWYDKSKSREAQELRLAHFSVEEYLISPQIQTGWVQQCDILEIPANATIAKMCLVYLLQFDRLNFSSSEMRDEYPLAKYAAQFWPQHSRIAQLTDKIDTDSMKLLSSKHAYTNSLRLYNPDPAWLFSGKRILAPLYYASLVGLVGLVKQMLDKDVNINAQEGSYGNALPAASWRGHDSIVQRLVDKGADVNAQGGVWQRSASSFFGRP